MWLCQVNLSEPADPQDPCERPDSWLSELLRASSLTVALTPRQARQEGEFTELKSIGQRVIQCVCFPGQEWDRAKLELGYRVKVWRVGRQIT